MLSIHHTLSIQKFQAQSACMPQRDKSMGQCFPLSASAPEAVRFSAKPSAWGRAIVLAASLLVSQNACQDQTLPPSSVTPQPTVTELPVKSASRPWPEQTLENLLALRKMTPTDNFTIEEVRKLVLPESEEDAALMPFATYYATQLANPNSQQISRQTLIEHLQAMDIDHDELISDLERVQAFGRVADGYLVKQADQLGLNPQARQTLVEILKSKQFAVSHVPFSNLSGTSQDEKIHRANVYSLLQELEYFLDQKVPPKNRNEVAKALLHVFLTTRNFPSPVRYDSQSNRLDYQQAVIVPIETTNERIVYDVNIKSVSFNVGTLQLIEEKIQTFHRYTLLQPTYYGALHPDILEKRREAVRALFQEEGFKQQIKNIYEAIGPQLNEIQLAESLAQMGELLSRKANIPTIPIELTTQKVPSEHVNSSFQGQYSLKQKKCLIFIDAFQQKINEYQANGGTVLAIRKAVLRQLLNTVLHEFEHAVQDDWVNNLAKMKDPRQRQTAQTYKRDIEGLGLGVAAMFYADLKPYEQSAKEQGARYPAAVSDEELDKLFPWLEAK